MTVKGDPSLAREPYTDIAKTTTALDAAPSGHNVR